MKTLLNIETFGIRLYLIKGIPNDPNPIYRFEWEDTYAPVEHTMDYKTKEEALGDIVNYILNPENWYALDEQPDALQKAYALAGVPIGVNPTRPEITDTVATFLYYTLDGITCANE